MKRFLVVLLIWASLLLLAGCATGAKTVNMTPTKLYVTSQHPYSVSTAVSGGEDTNALSHSKISDVAFRGALEAAIRNSCVFSQIVPINGADYHLEVVITNLGQPMAGFNMTVVLTTNWKLTKAGSSQPIWQDFIATKHTATVGDNVVAVERLRVANEGAARKNIEEGIRCLSALSL
jgi:hypothetical protein